MILSIGTTAFSQQRGHMEKFKEEKTKYFNEKLELSEMEAKKFWPIYEDLMNRNMKINEEERTLIQYYSINFIQSKF